MLQAANWQRAGDKHAPRPKPIPRPDTAGQPKPGRRIGAGGGVPIDQMKKRLGWD